MAQHIILLEPENRKFIALIKDIEDRLLEDVRFAIADAISDHFDIVVYGWSVHYDEISVWRGAHFIEDKIKILDDDGIERVILVERGYIY